MPTWFGGESATRYTYMEYQALMLGLALCMAVGLIAVEICLKRYWVLPVLFPGMFSIRERRLFFFDFEIEDAAAAERLRAQAKNLCRMTICVVLSYLWQRCILESQQHVGKRFPANLCSDDVDCFASELHFSTIWTREYNALNCSLQSAFEKTTVVSCIRLVKPAATEWLMHVAVSQALIQLNIKCYEVVSQIAGNSRCLRVLIGCSWWLILVTIVVLWLLGILTEFLSSWLAFVTMFSIPAFLWTVWKTAQIFVDLSRKQSLMLQHSLEEHFRRALSDVSYSDSKPVDGYMARTPSARLRNALKIAESARHVFGGLPRLSPKISKLRSFRHAIHKQPLEPGDSAAASVATVTPNSCSDSGTGGTCTENLEAPREVFTDITPALPREGARPSDREQFGEGEKFNL